MALTESTLTAVSAAVGPAGIRRFVLDALALAGAAYSEPDEELVLATCRITRPGTFFAPPAVVQENLQLVFTPEGAGRHPSAELVCPGSFRLQWFIREIRGRGFLTRQYYAEDLSTKRLEREVLSLLPSSLPRPSLRGQRRSFVPFFLAVLKLTTMAGEKHAELLPVALNLLDGTERPEIPARIRRIALAPDPGFQKVERMRITWKEVWRRLEEKARARFASLGTDWYQPALERLRIEGGLLEDYYREMAAEAGDPEAVRAEYLMRAQELRDKYAPMMGVTLANAALLYLPVIVFAAEGADGRPLPPLRYEPAAGRVEWAFLDRSG